MPVEATRQQWVWLPRRLGEGSSSRSGPGSSSCLCAGVCVVLCVMGVVRVQAEAGMTVARVGAGEQFWGRGGVMFCPVHRHEEPTLASLCGVPTSSVPCDWHYLIAILRPTPCDCQRSHKYQQPGCDCCRHCIGQVHRASQTHTLLSCLSDSSSHTKAGGDLSAQCAVGWVCSKQRWHCCATIGGCACARVVTCRGLATPVQ